MEVIQVGLANRIGPLKLENSHWLVKEWKVTDIQESSEDSRHHASPVLKIEVPHVRSTMWKLRTAPADSKETGLQSLNHKELSSVNHLNEPGRGFPLPPATPEPPESAAQPGLQPAGILEENAVVPTQIPALCT